jgi:hypothetical protein
VLSLSHYYQLSIKSLNLTAFFSLKFIYLYSLSSAKAASFNLTSFILTMYKTVGVIDNIIKKNPIALNYHN